MKTFILRSIRALYRRVKRPEFKAPSWCTIEERTEANKLINSYLQSDSAVFVGRIGAIEQDCVLNYLSIINKERLIIKLYQYVIDNIKLPWWDKNVLKSICNNAGFFPTNDTDLLSKFCELYLKDIPALDLCGRYHYFENFMPFKKEMKSVQLETLYPFFVSNPWTQALKGKNVLVVHPFTDTIKSQYKKRKLLFDNPEILPEFTLKTVTAVQSIANSIVPYKDWFEALETMKSKILETEFDVAIIGCGAYGLPLSAFVKRLGKKVVYLGGGTQLLFGIKGRRWEVHYVDSCYRDMFNEHWVYPSVNEKPVNAEKVEEGCYW